MSREPSGHPNTAPVAADYPDLAGTVAVVTGAARGMGAHFAAGLAQRGVHVVVGDIDEREVQATARRISDTAAGPRTTPGEVVARYLDVTDPGGHETLAQAAEQHWGRLDFWVNNAGIFPAADVLDISPAQMRDTFTVNVDGVLFGAQAAARRMVDAGHGVIVNMASAAAVRVRPSRAAYAASKAAVDHLTRSLAVELGGSGIRVNALAPGFVDTAMTSWLHEQPGALERALSLVPLGRIGSAEETLGPLLFLLSDSARYITGHTIAVDGGYRLV